MNENDPEVYPESVQAGLNAGAQGELCVFGQNITTRRHQEKRWILCEMESGARLQTRPPEIICGYQIRADKDEH